MTVTADCEIRGEDNQEVSKKSVKILLRLEKI